MGSNSPLSFYHIKNHDLLLVEYSFRSEIILGQNMAAVFSPILLLSRVQVWNSRGGSTGSEVLGDKAI